MSSAGNSAASVSAGRLIKLLCLLWLAGVGMRMTLLAIPPVIPLVHQDLHMSETQIGLLMGLPLALFAAAAVPGSLLVARAGASFAVLLGMTIAALAGGARGAAVDVWTLYGASIVTGFGIAIMQPGMPTLVREWLPGRIALGTIAYTTGMVMGAAFAPVLTIPFVLPLVHGSWRLDLVFWAVPAVLIVPAFVLLRPPQRDGRPSSARDAGAATVGRRRWWPSWKSPLVWVLGLALGGNTCPYFTTNAFLGDYLGTFGRTDLLAPALAWLNGAQIGALIILLLFPEWLQRRPWPFLVFGPLMLAAFLVIVFVRSPLAIIAGAGLIGICTAVTLAAALALPALLSAPEDVAPTAAGMFTISYTCAIVVPTVSGALWDMSGKSWAVWLPSCLCALVLTVLGTMATRYREAAESRSAA